MSTLDDTLALYDYVFPPELIAREPAHPRDSARMLVYNRKTEVVSFDTFAHICDHLPRNAVLVFNQTKVIPARMELTKETGGVIETVYLGQENGLLRVMASGKITSGDNLRWKEGHFFIVEERDGKFALLKPSFPLNDFHTLLDRYGETPLPPYIKDSPLSETERRTEYQTVYAKTEGSVAAPTAGLHFTEELLKKITQHGCAVRYVTLHVNLGTFAPVTEDQLQQKKLHEEFYEIDEDTAAFLNTAKAEGRPIIAVGTTTVRTLESAVETRHVASLRRLSGMTDTFITEDDTLSFVDGLVTNFHVPKSSLLMLVSALTGREKLLELYQRAIDEKCRLFSFGDGMLIL